MSGARGTVYLVGAGPGDPGLITARGAELLERAGAVVFDFLPDRGLLDLAPATAEIHELGTEAAHGDASAQRRTGELLVALALRHATVVRLKGGDPFLFGRGADELLHLRAAGVPCEVVPGVSSAIAAPAAAGIPVTHRGISSAVTFVSGFERSGAPEADPGALARLPGTLVYLMGVRRLADIAAGLLAGGRPATTPAALVRWGTLPRQQVLEGTLGDIAARAAAAGFRPPAVLVLGEVVRLRARLAWLERRPLFGRTVLVTRPRAQAAALGEALRERGAEVLAAPVFRVVPPADAAALREAAGRLATYDWVVLTSANGADSLFGTLGALDRDARAFGRARVAAIGPGTAAALARRGVRADLVPRRFVAEGLLESFGAAGGAGRRVLLWRAAEAREVLPDGLRAAGAEVDVVEAYRLADEPLAPEVAARIDAGEVHAAVFTSGSTVRGLHHALGDERFRRLGERAVLAAIGPVTAAELRRLGAPVGVESGEHTVRGLLDALVARLGAGVAADGGDPRGAG